MDIIAQLRLSELRGPDETVSGNKHTWVWKKAGGHIQTDRTQVVVIVEVG